MTESENRKYAHWQPPGGLGDWSASGLGGQIYGGTMQDLSMSLADWAAGLIGFLNFPSYLAKYARPDQ